LLVSYLTEFEITAVQEFYIIVLLKYERSRPLIADTVPVPFDESMK
jgi:hypothetical protein